MTRIKIAFAMVALAASVIAQAPNKMSNLKEPFTKVCLKALLAIGDFKGTASLTGPAKNAYEDARAKANSADASETLMITNLTSFAIMRSADNQARENIMQKVAEKARHDGERPNANPMRQNVRQYPELSAALDSINERESGCSAELEKAFRRRIAIPLPGTCLSK